MFDWKADDALLHGKSESTRPIFKVRQEPSPNISATLAKALESERDIEANGLQPCLEMLRNLSLSSSSTPRKK
jgi:hypothetical protein